MARTWVLIFHFQTPKQPKQLWLVNVDDISHSIPIRSCYINPYCWWLIEPLKIPWLIDYYRDLQLPGLLGIMITHSNKIVGKPINIHQPTSKLVFHEMGIKTGYFEWLKTCDFFRWWCWESSVQSPLESIRAAARSIKSSSSSFSVPWIPQGIPQGIPLDFR